MVKAATPLARSSTLTGRPIVSTDGTSPYEVQDLVLGDDGRQIGGFTLREPGLLGHRHVAVLPITEVAEVGPDAVMVPEEPALELDGGEPALCADVVGSRVVTKAGQEVGKVSDVVVQHEGEALRVEAIELHATEGTRYLVLDDESRLASDVVVVADGAEERLRETPEQVADDLGVGRR